MLLQHSAQQAVEAVAAIASYFKLEHTIASYCKLLQAIASHCGYRTSLPTIAS